MSDRDVDIVVIGCGPAGEKAAVRAAYLGKRVAIIERSVSLGGKCFSGGLPSKVLRDAALSYSGARRRLGDLFRTAPTHRLPMEWFTTATASLCDAHAARAGDSLERHGVRLVRGAATLRSKHEVEVEVVDGQSELLSCDKIIVATGSRPFRPGFIPFDEPNVHCSTTLLAMSELPRRLIVIGGGAIGSEYASIFAALDVEVTLIEGRETILPFLDAEIADRLIDSMRRRGVRMVLGGAVATAERAGGEIVVETDVGGRFKADALLFAGGRLANTETLGLEALGVELGRKGRPIVNASFQTTVENIYAAGDVIGFPALASTGAEQGKAAAAHACLEGAISLKGRPDIIPLESCAPYELLPLGIYTIPSVSMVGLTEAQARAAGRDVVVGAAAYADRDRGRLLGDLSGMLKLVCDAETQEILGVHIVGENAEELIHIGQACMHFGGTTEYFVRTVFNFPTLSSLYKSAAYDVLSNLPGAERPATP